MLNFFISLIKLIISLGMLFVDTLFYFIIHYLSPLNSGRREQGKHHLTAVCAVFNKLTSIIYTVYISNAPYEPWKFE